MNEEKISRRRALSFCGVAAVFAFAVPTAVLTVGEAEAQTPGMERREDRRWERRYRRQERRWGRTDRRQVRLWGRTGRRQERRGIAPTTGATTAPATAAPAKQ